MRKNECVDGAYHGLLKQIMCIHKKIHRLQEKNRLLYYFIERLDKNNTSGVFFCTWKNLKMKDELFCFIEIKIDMKFSIIQI
jgi:hypothetical protein